MTATHKNRVQMTVSGTPGTGTITLNAASSGHQSFGAALGADAVVDVLMVDGTAWEVARGCTYTHSGTTLSRGTLEESSTGSAISLTSATVVSLIATAERGRQWTAAAMDHVAGSDAATAMSVNTLYVVDMSAWATADRTYTLPTTAAVGDRIGVMVTSGNASFELLLTAATSDTLNGVAGGTEWSRMFITGEVVIMRCVTANSAWVVEYDGRIPCEAVWHATGSGSVTQSISGSTWTKVLDDTFNTELFDVGGIMGSDGTYIAAVVRRAGRYEVTAGLAIVSLDDQKEGVVGIFLNAEATPSYRTGRLSASGTVNLYPKGTIHFDAAVGDKYTLGVYHFSSTAKNIFDAVGYNYFSIVELL